VEGARWPVMPGSPSREPRECVSGFNKRGSPRLALFDVPLSETEIQEARAASRGNGVHGATDADSLSLRFGLQSMYFLTDFLLIAVNAQHQSLRFGLRSIGFFSVVRGKPRHPWPLPANADEHSPTRARPKNTEGFRGDSRRSQAAAYYFRSRLSALSKTECDIKQ